MPESLDTKCQEASRIRKGPEVQRQESEFARCWRNAGQCSPEGSIEHGLAVLGWSAMVRWSG